MMTGGPNIMQRDKILLSYSDIYSHFIQSKDLTTIVSSKINFSVDLAPSGGLKPQMISEFEHTQSFYWLHFRNLGNRISQLVLLELLIYSMFSATAPFLGGSTGCI